MINKTIKCRDGSTWTDPRDTVEEWLGKAYPGAEFLTLCMATGELHAKVYLDKEERVSWVRVPDDVLFVTSMLKGGTFMKSYCANRETTGTVVHIKRADAQDFRLENFTPEESLKHVKHSPGGFEWGYAGSGPAQLAFAILLDVTGDPEIAQRHYQDFKARFIANLKVEKWEIPEEDVKQWLRNVDDGRLV